MSISNVIISTPDDVYNLIKSGKELSTKFPYNHSKKTNGKVINLQLGRIWINNLLPDDFPLINEPVDKKKLDGLIIDLYHKYGTEETSKIITNLQSEAFKLATLSQNTFNIVQLEGLYLTPYIKTIRQHSNALISLRAHNVEHEIWERTVASTKRTPKRWYLQHIAKRLKRMEQEALQQVDLLVPISKKDEGALVELGCKAPRITIPFGINADDFIAHFTVKTNHTPQVFHLGGLDWQPNQDGIIWFIENCWPQVLQAIPNAKFTIAGRNAPQRLLNNLNGRGIEYIGEVDNAKQFIANAGIMIVPLRIGSGMRIKIVEGMALGKAIVSTAIGAEGIDYTNGQNILIANTPSAFAKSLIDLLSNQELELKIGAAAKEFATQTFGIKVQAEKLLDFYNKSVIQINS